MIIQRTESVNDDNIRRLDTCEICDEQFPMRLTEPVKHVCPRCREYLFKVVRHVESVEESRREYEEESKYQYVISEDGTSFTKVRVE